jgi:predicted RecB family nuclease
MRPITSETVVAYLRCPRESYFLMFTEKRGNIHPYIHHIIKQRASHRSRFLANLRQGNSIARKYQNASDLKIPDGILTDVVLTSERFEASCDVLVTPAKGRKSKHNYHQLTLITGTHLVSEAQKIELGYASYVLGKTAPVRPPSGKIISLDGKPHRITLAPIYKKLNLILSTIQSWNQETPVPPPILNRNCPSCRFHDECHSDALEIDHLSLLGGMSAREIERQNDRGFFTTKQLSYTYRPRKQRKDQENRIPKYHHSLKALALGEKRTYVVRRPEQPRSKTQIFLDIEGVPDRGSYYLIGLLIREKNSHKKINLWADSEDDEKKIWSEFQLIVEQYDDFVIYHYGDYDARALRHLARKFGASSVTVAAISNRLINVLSLIYGSIYFPTYGNGLKEVASFLGAKWSQESASGLMSVVWRFQWEETREDALRQKLIDYNVEDCHALEVVAEKVRKILANEAADILETDDIKKSSTYKYGRTDFVSEHFSQINRRAYFDYQRERIFFRDRKKPRRSMKQRKGRSFRANKVVKFPMGKSCPVCGKKDLYGHGTSSKTVHDLWFYKHGVKRWVVRYVGQRARCRACLSAFNSPAYNRIRGKYGHSLYSWIIYQTIALRQTHGRVREHLEAVFGYTDAYNLSGQAKEKMAKEYSFTYNRILAKIRNSNLVHADETAVSIMGSRAYVWVFTTLEEVVYVYSPTRESKVLKDTLKKFKGVLISDFYAAYDSIDCPHQKCLIHLLRDINDDLRKHPFDEAFKPLVQEFGELLNSIVGSIDRFGLKHRHLRKHKKAVDRFFRNVFKMDGSSDIVRQYQKRLRKNRDSLFTFLDHDGVPWNNNNAEHAIKHFAVYRNITNGCFSETGIRRYLTLLSIYQTCKYKEVNFLQFLLSKSKDIDTFKARSNSRGR